MVLKRKLPSRLTSSSALEEGEKAVQNTPEESKEQHAAAQDDSKPTTPEPKGPVLDDIPEPTFEAQPEQPTPQETPRQEEVAPEQASQPQEDIKAQTAEPVEEPATPEEPEPEAEAKEEALQTEQPEEPAEQPEEPVEEPGSQEQQPIASEAEDDDDVFGEPETETYTAPEQSSDDDTAPWMNEDEDEDLFSVDDGPSTPQEDQAAKPKAQKSEMREEVEGSASAPADDMMVSHTEKIGRDSEQLMDQAMEDVTVGIVDPADQEIEAAYMNLPEENKNGDESVGGRAKVAVKGLMSKLTEMAHDMTHKDEKKPEKDVKPADGDIPPPDQPKEAPPEIKDKPEEKLKKAEEKAKEKGAETEGHAYGDEVETPPVEEKKEKGEEFTPPPSFAEEGDEGEEPLPWMPKDDDSDDWTIEGLSEGPQKSDPYADLGGKTEAKEEQEDNSHLPPWHQSDYGEPPILPTGGDGGSGHGAKIISLLLIVALIGGGAFYILQNREKSTEMVARWTGALTDVSEDVPQADDTQEYAEADLVEPEEVVTPEELAELQGGEGMALMNTPEGVSPTEEESFLADDLPELAGLSEDEKKQTESDAVKEQELIEAEEAEESDAKIEFVDELEEKAKEPIVAEEEMDVPEEVSLFASLQKAILKAKEDKRKETSAKTGDEPEDLDPTQLSPEELSERNFQIKQELEDELATYRRTLAEIDNPALRPNPRRFFEDPEKYEAIAEGKTAGEEGQKQAPEEGGVIDKDVKIGYDENPYNLPIIPEPEKVEKPPVRTLEEFDLAMFEPPRRSVRIPEGLKPRLQSSDFPALEILSIIPNKGIIAYSRGREGVLLLGESIEGWELVAVKNQHAEFSNGQRKHVVTLETFSQ